MTTSNKIIIALLTLIIVIAVAWIVMDYQKTEKQYQACLEKCEAMPCGFASTTLGITEKCKTCEPECREKYGK